MSEEAGFCSKARGGGGGFGARMATPNHNHIKSIIFHALIPIFAPNVSRETFSLVVCLIKWIPAYAGMTVF
jgi:hypothetical protein